MNDLFVPGDHRAGALMSDRSFAAAMIRVEWAWYAVLADADLAPALDLPDVELSDADIADLAEAAEAGGNPVIPLLGRLRDAVPEAARVWLHKGLTSQDVVDTALVLLLGDVLDVALAELVAQIRAVQRLAGDHRATVCVARTLSQHAVPTTFGAIVAGWLDGLLDAAQELATLRGELPVQVGGAAGTLAAIELLAPGEALDLGEELAERLGLAPSLPWHGFRRILTSIGDSLVAATDTWGRIANDVVLRARPEVGELSEGAVPGRGGSSTMPHKQNPVLSVLLRRTALNAPFLGAALHAAAAAWVDQRAEGAWHAEWAPLRSLARLTVIAARQGTELLEHLQVHPESMAATADRASVDLLAEARALAELTGTEAPVRPADYLGVNDELIGAAVERADAVLEEVRG